MKEKVRVFENDKERIKAAVIDEVVNFCEMIDCVDEPPALKYSVTRFGIKILIDASVDV